jgi:DNA-binding winged helix-turn-helix (wHTH) protein
VQQLTFGPFRLDASGGRLLRDGVEIELRRQAFQALRVLLHNSGRNVCYEEMIQEAWEGTQVSRHTVAVTVGEVRKALDEYGSWITHRPKLGYCLEKPPCEDLIRKGWHFHNRCTREGFEKAIDCFQKAAIRDATDPRSLEGMCRTYLALGTCGMRPPREMYLAFLAVYRQAVALTGLTPELRLDRGHGLHIFERKPAEAEVELLQARRESTRPAAVDIYLTMLYSSLGRLDEALDLVAEAKGADALWPMVTSTEISVYFCRREFDRAVACGQQALELHPYLAMARLFYAQALEFSGRAEEALAQYRLASVLSPDLLWLRALEATCLARLGRQCEAAALCTQLQQSRATEYVDAYYMALLRDALGDRNGAFRELERAFEENSATLPILDIDPKMDSLRRDPRFRHLRDRLFWDANPLRDITQPVQIAAAC